MEALTPLALHPELQICNIDLFSGNTLKSLRAYYRICSEASDLLVTTSCFAEWKKGGNTNGSAKVIPAVPAGTLNSEGQAVRVFFFDDNINLTTGASSGAADTKGICNLRDIATGQYVDFSAGCNGFECDTAYRHTLIHHSSEYQNILVQANILDAMSNPDYFSGIINKYARGGEKLVVYMDINGTILWNDSIMEMGPAEILLGTMFGFTEIRPRRPFDMNWKQQPKVKVEKTQVLKQLLTNIARGDNQLVHEFWKRDKFSDLMAQVGSNAELGWVGKTDSFSAKEFFTVYQGYMEELHKQERAQGKDACGVTVSWFKCVSKMRQGRHAIVINTFGMDSHKVVIRSCRDARRVPHIAVNYDCWTERDLQKFAAQFHSEVLPPPAPRCMFTCADVDIDCKRGERCGDSSTDALGMWIGPKEPDHIFEFVVRKPEQKTELGAKVNHIDQGLRVAQIFPKGPIYEANAMNRASAPPKDALRVGDVIQQVNKIEGDTKAMVQECRRCVNLKFVVARPATVSNPGGLCGGPSDPFEEEVVLPQKARKSSTA
mmetsp:Transcript_96510/g.270108  ORF Transcript_96510/g.270108 Transcript_96510/m.270108 type:complete len:546 (-) Transcript_96510:260-1897(-)